MQQDRTIVASRDLEDREEALLVQRSAVDVAVDLQPAGAELGQRPLGLPRRALGQVQGNGRNEPGEVIGVVGDQLGHAVVADAAEVELRAARVRERR